MQQKQWKLVGKTINHTFTKYSKKERPPYKSGIYIAAYSHLRGHIAGFAVHFLEVGFTSELELLLDRIQQSKTLEKQCYNSFFFQAAETLGEREVSIITDLKAQGRCIV